MTPPAAVPPGTIADCCADKANRVLQPGNPAQPQAVHEKCAACGRNHYRMLARFAPFRRPGDGVPPDS
jgi:hypothetical protein